MSKPEIAIIENRLIILDKRKKEKLQRIYIISAAVLIMLASFVLLVLYRPAGFSQPVYQDDKSVSSYLTHELSPEFYGKVQLRQGFDIAVTQEGINDIIAHSKWPQIAGEFTILPPIVFFEQGRVKIIGTVIYKGLDFVVTVSGKPLIDTEGKLNVKSKSVKIGAVNATGIAGNIAKIICERKLSEKNVDVNDFSAKLAKCIIWDEPVDVAVKIKGNKVKLNKTNVEKGRILLGFEPFFD